MSIIKYDSLTSYARAHIRLLQIRQRFNAKVKTTRWGKTYAVRTAISQGEYAIESFMKDQQFFDFFVHKKPIRSY